MPTNLHVSQFASNLANPAKTFLWNVHIPGLSSASIQAQTSQIPSVDSTDMELYFMGQQILYPGAVEYENTWTIAIAESEYGNVIAELYAWRQLVWNQETATSSIPTAFKQSISVVALSSQGVPWLRIILKGAYPKTIDTVDLDRSNNSEAWQWNVTFNFDWWYKK